MQKEYMKIKVNKRGEKRKSEEKGKRRMNEITGEERRRGEEEGKKELTVEGEGEDSGMKYDKQL
ncbi:uncharacterized, partial [Tachysurus ichikawai]